MALYNKIVICKGFIQVFLLTYQSLVQFPTIRLANCTDSTTKIDKPTDKGGFLFVF